MSTLDTRSGLGNDVPLWKRYVAGHHWRNAEEEFDACTLGFWLFLATEVLLFAGLFCAYAILRFKYPDAFVNGSSYLDWRWGCVNTGVLLISSYTMAASIRMFQLDRQSTGKLLLAITFICGIGFLFVKGTFEYLPKLSGWFFFLDPALPHYLDFKNGEALGGLFVHIDGYGGKAPGQFFSYAFSSDPWEPLWWSVYYCATGIHALHVVIGMSLIAWCWVRARMGAYGPTHYTMVENTGLYWHLVDLIWIFLFPLLYLIH
jgi:cytochrome c oxidase subunit 3